MLLRPVSAPLMLARLLMEARELSGTEDPKPSALCSTFWRNATAAAAMPAKLGRGREEDAGAALKDTPPKLTPARAGWSMKPPPVLMDFCLVKCMDLRKPNQEASDELEKLSHSPYEGSLT